MTCENVTGICLLHLEWKMCLFPRWAYKDAMQVDYEDDVECSLHKSKTARPKTISQTRWFSQKYQWNAFPIQGPELSGVTTNIDILNGLFISLYNRRHFGSHDSTRLVKFLYGKLTEPLLKSDLHSLFSLNPYFWELYLNIAFGSVVISIIQLLHFLAYQSIH